MKFYSKKISSIEELKREQLRLQYEKLQHSRESLLPIKELNRQGNGAGKNFLDFAMDLLGSGSKTQLGFKLAKPLLRLIVKRSKKNVFKAVKEVGGGYLKWKAIEMGFNGIKLFVKSQQKKRMRNARMKMH